MADRAAPPFLTPELSLNTSGDLCTFRAMGSPCQIRVSGVSTALPEVREAVERAVAEVRRIEHRYSRYQTDSVISRINSAAGSDSWMAVDPETSGLLNFAAQLFSDSEGKFDITSGVWRRVWDFRTGRVPSDTDRAALRHLVGWAQVEFDGQRIRLPLAGMEIDFGGIGKEYAADRAATLLTQAGLSHGYVNLGGDIRLLGSAPDGSPWRMGIAHPRAPQTVMAELAMTAGGLATSGDYERFFMRDGQRYCHIIDPRTGWPVHHWQSVSVVAPACLAAGALATIAMLSGNDAPDLLRDQGVEFLMVRTDGTVLQG